MLREELETLTKLEDLINNSEVSKYQRVGSVQLIVSSVKLKLYKI